MSRGASSSFMNSYLRSHEQYKPFMHDFLTLPVHFLTLLWRFLPFQEGRDLFLSFHFLEASQSFPFWRGLEEEGKGKVFHSLFLSSVCC